MPVFRPIILVHGWGGVADFVRDFNENDERDPYVGWNEGHRYNDPEGWVKFRDTQPNFEGIVLRLVKEFRYYDASNDDRLEEFRRFLGAAPGPSGEPGPQDADPRKSLWVFRYYEYNAEHLRLPAEVLAGLEAEVRRRGYRGPYAGIPYYAAMLAVKVQQIACADCHTLDAWPSETPQGGGLGLERVYLVGHSMGGLIARFALQYNLFGAADNVARLLTLSTPHGGARYAIPSRLLRFLPGMRHDDVTFLDPAWVDKYMGGQDVRPDGNGPKARLPLGPSDAFALVGTRHEGYYPLARSLPRTDGIVHQDEAYLAHFPYAYAYNTHSGEFGIRENHDAYQSLRRFLFGDLRVRVALRDIAFADGFAPPEGTRFFFQYFVKPRGINTHLNEISERSENQPRPRTIEELQAAVGAGRYVLFDGFADSAARVPSDERDGLGIAREDRDLPHLQMEYASFAYDDRVGGKPLSSGFVMLPLRVGEREVPVSDPAFRATLTVSVTHR